METRFEWDPSKAALNLRKHRVRFESAALAFADPFALVDGCLLLLVAHTVWDSEDGAEVIRIISARHADPKERKRHEQNRSLLD